MMVPTSMPMNGESRPPISSAPGTLKVLDLGRYLAGPVTATLLGDLGAEVIKVERPGIGDLARHVPPVPAGEDGMSYEFQVEARNKRSVTLDYSRPAGAAILKRLVEWADILIENFTPGTMEKWGLGYEELRAVNPRLVYVAVSGFGRTGPYRNRPGYDYVASAFSGLMYATGVSDGPPTTTGYSISDLVTPAYAALGAVEAVRRRDAPGGTGRGELVDIGLYEAMLRAATPFIPLYVREGRNRERESSRPRHDGREALATWGYTFCTADDKWLVMMPPFNPAQRRLFSDMAGQEIPEEPIHGAPRFHAIWEAYCRTQSQADLLDRLHAASVPVGPVNSIADLCADEHVRERNLVTVPNYRGEPLTMQGVVPRLAGDPGRIRWTGEPLGASNADVYGTLLGLSADEMEGLAADGVL